jgi:hypothetical protein
MYILKLSLLAAIAPLCWGAWVKTESPEKVPYPEGYRRWTHVRSGLTGPESPDYQLTGGLHHIYANDKAMEGYEAGRFPHRIRPAEGSNERRPHGGRRAPLSHRHAQGQQAFCRHGRLGLRGLPEKQPHGSVRLAEREDEVF